MEGDEQRRRSEKQTQRDQWQARLAASEALTAKILAEREGKPLDVDKIWAETRADLEGRHDYLFDN